MHLYFILMGIILACMIFCTLKRIWVVKCKTVQQITLHNTYVCNVYIQCIQAMLKKCRSVECYYLPSQMQNCALHFLFVLLDLTINALGCFQFFELKCNQNSLWFFKISLKITLWKLCCFAKPKLLDKLRNESRSIYYKRCCNSVGCFPIDHNTNLNIVIVALARFKTLYVNHNIVVASWGY